MRKKNIPEFTDCWSFLETPSDIHDLFLAGLWKRWTRLRTVGTTMDAPSTTAMAAELLWLPRFKCAFPLSRIMTTTGKESRYPTAISYL